MMWQLILILILIYISPLMGYLIALNTNKEVESMIKYFQIPKTIAPKIFFAYFLIAGIAIGFYTNKLVDISIFSFAAGIISGLVVNKKEIWFVASPVFFAAAVYFL